MKQAKRIISVLLTAFMMAFSLSLSLPVTAKAADSYAQVTGTVSEVQRTIFFQVV